MTPKAIYAVVPMTPSQLARLGGRQFARDEINRALAQVATEQGVYEIGPRTRPVLMDPPDYLTFMDGYVVVYVETPVAPIPSMAEAAR